MDYSKYKFGAVVDWIEVEFHTIEPSQGRHVCTGSRFSFVRGCDPVTGIPYKKPNTTTTRFIGRIQDPENYSTLLNAITSHPSVDQSKPASILKIEVAFDAYARARTESTELDDLTVHLYRHLSNPASMNQAAYTRKHRRAIPKQCNNSNLAGMLHDGFVIGIGHKDNDPIYQRLYTKRSDGGASANNRRDLPTSEHRTRFENQIVCRELSEIFGNGTLQSFQQFRFEQLSGHFNFRTIQGELSEFEQQLVDARPWQVANMGKQRRSKGGGERLYSRNSYTIQKLNDRARDALRRLSKRWRK